MLVKQLNENHDITMVDSSTPNRERTTKASYQRCDYVGFRNQLNHV
jgi:hypothetical protein